MHEYVLRVDRRKQSVIRELLEAAAQGKADFKNVADSMAQNAASKEIRTELEDLRDVIAASVVAAGKKEGEFIVQNHADLAETKFFVRTDSRFGGIDGASLLSVEVDDGVLPVLCKQGKVFVQRNGKWEFFETLSNPTCSESVTPWLDRTRRFSPKAPQRKNRKKPEATPRAP